MLSGLIWGAVTGLQTGLQKEWRQRETQLGQDWMFGLPPHTQLLAYSDSTDSLVPKWNQRGMCWNCQQCQITQHLIAPMALITHMVPGLSRFSGIELFHSECASHSKTGSNTVYSQFQVGGVAPKKPSNVGITEDQHATDT